MRRLLLPSVIALSLSCAAPASATRGAGPATDPGQLCRQAILAAEREHRLPAALLHAIARVESGRPDPRTGAGVSWPWTINAQGQGRFFETKEAAIAAVRALQARGVTVIDVGCLQVNLHHHPRAFASLEEAFDPMANALYAGLFLTRLHQNARNWERAAAHYHSQTPERAEAYRLKVLAAWPGMAHRLAAERLREAAERERDAMFEAWGGAGGRPSPTASGIGFQAVALGLSQRGSRAAVAGRGLLDPVPAEIAVARRADRAARPRPQEVAEAAATPRRR
ncbi:hypothetical protein GCM10009416_35130 [Craurococcus roseus]|uniref:Lytic transglycosylase domain-containing protein n=1 Tax=Craurococcus roseus TaxID=77585 RepID=A0ABP3QMD3_9PROT